MIMEELSDKKIIDSWHKNASPWIKAIQEQQIESRKLVTDQAIIDTIRTLAGKTVFDIGCGEGWLARELATLGFQVSGIDVVPALITVARKAVKGKFTVLAYEDITRQSIPTKVDIIVCNFSLLGKESVEHLFQMSPQLLNKGGYFVIQTPHPVSCCGDQIYESGWRTGSWQGFSNGFADPAPWYFRTISAWLALFLENKLSLVQFRETIIPKSGTISSLILVGQLSGVEP